MKTIQKPELYENEKDNIFHQLILNYIMNLKIKKLKSQ